jgi:DNA adenine methylase
MLQELAMAQGFEMKLIAMKNTHHAKMSELLIRRDFSWVNGGAVM